MKWQQAYEISSELIAMLKTHFVTWEVCGSIRRRKEEVHDIDIVAIPRAQYQFGEPALSDDIRRIDRTGLAEAKNLGKGGAKRFLDGKDLKRFQYKGISIDLYLANPENFSCLKLIRTGSTEHNIKLTILAKGKGLRLFASGDGLCEYRMEGDKAIPTRIIEYTEDGILQYLLGRIPSPEERN